MLEDLLKALDNYIKTPDNKVKKYILFVLITHPFSAAERTNLAFIDRLSRLAPEDSLITTLFSFVDKAQKPLLIFNLSMILAHYSLRKNEATLFEKVYKMGAEIAWLELHKNLIPLTQPQSTKDQSNIALHHFAQRELIANIRDKLNLYLSKKPHAFSPEANTYMYENDPLHELAELQEIVGHYSYEHTNKISLWSFIRNQTLLNNSNLQIIHTAITTLLIKTTDTVLEDILSATLVDIQFCEYLLNIKQEILHSLNKIRNSPDKKRIDSERRELRDAIVNHNISKVQELLAAHCSIRWKTKEGNTPLHLAVIHRAPIIISLLLNHKADPTIHNDNKDYPIELAAMHEYWDCIQAFRVKKTTQEDRAHYGYALWSAIDAEHFDTVKLLLKANTPTDTWEVEDDCPLHRAVRKNNLNIVKLLCEYEANLELKNTNDNLTALELAQKLQHTSCAEYLAKKMNLAPPSISAGNRFFPATPPPLEKETPKTPAEPHSSSAFNKRKGITPTPYTDLPQQETTKEPLVKMRKAN